MKKLLLALFLLAGASAHALAPVFIGATTDYITNTTGTITFTFSNSVKVIFRRGDGHATFNGGIKVEGSSVNLTNLPGTGGFVAIDSGGALFRTNVPTATLVTNFDGIVITNGVADVISTATRTGGALTNITLNAQGPQIVHADGSTNVNVVAIMNWAAGLQRPVTLLITNRTATVRTFSLGATTNNFIGMGSVTAPISVTNALWVAFENLGTSNVVYAAQYIANPTN